MSRTWVILIVFLAAALAGCIGASDGERAEAGSDQEEGERGEVEPPASDGDGPEGAPEDPSEEPALVEETRELTWDGYIPEWALVCAPAYCHWTPPVTSTVNGWDSSYDVGMDPFPVSASLTLTWDDPHAEVQEMAIGISRDDCPDGPCDFVDYEVGTSGVTLTTDLDLAPEDIFYIVVWHPWEQVGDAGHQSGAPVDFVVEGDYQVLVEA